MKSTKKLYLLPKDIHDLVASTSNIYESTVVITKRAKQIAINRKEALDRDIEALMANGEDKESTDQDIQSHITQQDENQLKPVLLATHQFLDGELDFHY